MKTFQDYIEELDQQAQTPQESPLGDRGMEPPAKSIERTEINDDNLSQAIKIAYKKHRHQTEKFLQRLAEVDPDIKSAMSGNKVPDRAADNFDPNKDEVTPPEADGAQGQEDQSSGE